MKDQIIDFVKDGYTPEQELFAWELMCGKKFENFIKTPKRKRSVEDYGKYMGISMVFHFRRIFLRLIKDGESRLDEILAYLTTEGKKQFVVERWIMEAVDTIPDHKLKEIALEWWNESKSKFNEQDFDISKLF